LRGNAYGSKGDYARALADLTQAIKLNPNKAAAYGGRGFYPSAQAQPE
jgi:lipoprotein NlpI